jgi:hypothetical protein
LLIDIAITNWAKVISLLPKYYAYPGEEIAGYPGRGPALTTRYSKQRKRFKTES